MEKNKVVVNFKKIVVDIIMFNIVLWTLVIIYYYSEAFQRGFFCDDQTLHYPIKKSPPGGLIPLYLISILTPSISIALIEILIRNSYNYKTVYIGKLKIPRWIYETSSNVFLLIFGALWTVLATNIIKFQTGRPRPNFIAMCQPDVCLNYNRTLPSPFFENYNCTNEKYVNNWWAMRGMRVSFPSGHSALIAATMFYFTIYLHKKLTLNSLKLLKFSLQCAAILMIILMSLARVSDYRHHWDDVVVGAILGILCSFFTAKFCSNLYGTPTNNFKNRNNHPESENLNQE